MLSKNRSTEKLRLEKTMEKATSYKEWREAALEHDYISGMEDWKRTEKSDVYDNANIRARLNTLRDLRSREDYQGLLFALNEGIHGNQGGMGNEALYGKAKFGTKHLIEEYVDELVESLKDIANVPENVISWNDKSDFFHRASLCFGRTALMLSGAGSLGHFHGGVVKAFLEQNLLPDVISGTSAGSAVAAVLGTHSDAELKKILRKGEGLLPSTEDMGQVDDAQVAHALAKAIPDLTFQEAYEKTGRKISISIAPMEEHQTSRLMNAITSPNVFIRSAVQASSAVPGVLSPVMLMAKNVYGETQPYLPNRRWVDGSVTDDLPAKRLARLYAVNHYVVSQANPLALALRAADNNPFLPTPMKNVMRYSTNEWLKYAEQYSRRYLRAVPDVGKNLSMFYSLMAQEYKGDVNIAPSFTYFDPQKLLSQLSPEEVNALMLEGERAAWQRMEQVRISSKIGRTLDAIMDDHTQHDVRTSYKKRTTSPAPGKREAPVRRKTEAKVNALPKTKAKAKPRTRAKSTATR